MRFDGYTHCEAKTIFDKFIYNADDIIITEGKIIVKLKRKRKPSITLEVMKEIQNYIIHGYGVRSYWLKQRQEHNYHAATI